MSSRSGRVREKTENVREEETSEESEEEGESVTSARANVSTDHVVDGGVESLNSEESVRRNKGLVERGGITNKGHETESEEEENGNVVKRTDNRDNGIGFHRAS